MPTVDRLLDGTADDVDLVIGVGNSLMGDDGLGIAAISMVRDRWPESDALAVVDGGTWGMNLLPLIEQARRLLIVDAIDRGLPPGTPIRLEREEIPRYFALRLSPHQLDLREVLALAELRGSLPDETVAIGIQPEHVGLSTALSGAVVARFDDLIGRVDAQLAEWGHTPVAAPEAACTR